MVQKHLLNLYHARTAGMLSGASRVAVMLLATLLLTMTAQTAWAEKIDLSNDGITVVIPEQTYTGSPLTPDVTVSYGDEVISDEHYTVTLPDGRTNAGDYTITITAKEGSALYVGSVTKTFTILPKEVETPVIIIENQGNLIYNDGQALAPGIVVKESSAEGAPEIDPSEYRIVRYEYEGEAIAADALIHSGNYKVYITDAKTDTGNTGNYTFGEVSNDFVILPKTQNTSYSGGNVGATVLEGHETSLTAGWYVCKTTLDYDHTVNLNGEVNIIIADGATMTIGTADSPVSGKGLSANNNLNIFGQSAGTGVLRTNSSDNGIYVTNGVLTITNCTVDVVCNGNYGIYAINGITINGKSDGTNSVTVRSGQNGIYTLDSSSSIAITNCTVDVVCSGNGSYGIYAPNGITINGISDGTNSVTVRSGQNGIYSIDGSVAITNCDVTVTGATLTNNTYNPCSGEGIHGYNDLTLAGCTNGNTVTVRSNNSCLSSPNGSVGITNCTVDVVCSGNDYYGINATGDITIDGKSDGSNSVTVRSGQSGIYSPGGSVAITNCDVTVTGATLTNNTYNPCSGKGINGYEGITLAGCTTGNTVTVRSNNGGLSSGGGTLGITNCTVDVVCSGNDYYGIYGINASESVVFTNCTIDVVCSGNKDNFGISGNKGITINGKSDGTNRVTVRSNKYGIYSVDGSVAITNCDVTVTGATLTNNTYNPCSGEGINGTKGITISGCATGNTVTVRSDNRCLYSEDGTLGITNCTVDVASTGNNAIYSSNMNFNGGQLTAMAPDNCKGIYTKGTCTLGWANAETDFIKVSKYYSDEVVMIANGKHFRATKNENDTETTVAIISGTLSESEIASIAGTTLKPYDITGYVVTTVGDNFTTSATPAYTNGDTKFYLYEKDATVTVAYTGEGIIEVTDMNAIDFSDNHTFTMPAYDVILTSKVLNNADFTLANSSVDYNAAAQAPGIKYNNADFSVDYYTLSYTKDGQGIPPTAVQNPGNYAVTLTGKGAYIGTVHKNEVFVINPSLVGATTLYAEGSTNQWMTWCGTEELVTPEDVTVYTVSGISNNSITLNDVTTTAYFGTQSMKVIPAYTPVLLYRETVNDDALEGMFLADGEGVSGVQTAQGTTGCAFYGTTTALESIPDANYTADQTYVLYGDRFLLCKDNAGINANKCWLVLNSANGARQLSIVINDETTAVESEKVIVNSEEFAAATVWYDMQGRKLDGKPTKKGLYIYKGKKVVIK